MGNNETTKKVPKKRFKLNDDQLEIVLAMMDEEQKDRYHKLSRHQRRLIRKALWHLHESGKNVKFNFAKLPGNAQYPFEVPEHFSSAQKELRFKFFLEDSWKSWDEARKLLEID